MTIKISPKYHKQSYGIHTQLIYNFKYHTVSDLLSFSGRFLIQLKKILCIVANSTDHYGLLVNTFKITYIALLHLAGVVPCRDRNKESTSYQLDGGVYSWITGSGFRSRSKNFKTNRSKTIPKIFSNSFFNKYGRQRTSKFLHTRGRH